MINCKKAILLLFLITCCNPRIWATESIKGENLVFQKECIDGERVNIAAAGDILMHLVLQVQALRYNGYEHMWSELKPLFQKMDVVYGNLETPIAPGHFLKSGIPDDRSFYSNKDYQTLLQKGYSNFPRFNAGPELLEALSKDFNILSTANNHTFDRGNAGVDATIESLENHGFGSKIGRSQDGDYTGTKKSNAYNDRWFAKIKRNGISMAFLACTYHTNGINTSNRTQVLRCMQPGSKQVANEELMEITRKLSKQFDAVIVTPHWGEEYTAKVDSQRRAFTKELFRNGALAVLGSHPHVLQKWEKMTIKDIHGKEKERFVIYSLGNFFANQGQGSIELKDVKQRTSVILTMGLVKDRNGETHIEGTKYLPYYMTTGTTAVLSHKRRSIVPFYSSEVENNLSLLQHVQVAEEYVNDIFPREQRIENFEDISNINYCR